MPTRSIIDPINVINLNTFKLSIGEVQGPSLVPRGAGRGARSAGVPRGGTDRQLGWSPSPGLTGAGRSPPSPRSQGPSSWKPGKRVRPSRSRAGVFQQTQEPPATTSGRHAKQRICSGIIFERLSCSSIGGHLVFSSDTRLTLVPGPRCRPAGPPRATPVGTTGFPSIIVTRPRDPEVPTVWTSALCGAVP